MSCKNDKERQCCEYNIQRTGSEVAGLLDKIDNLGLATPIADGLMSALDKAKLDKISVRYNTTEYWNRQIGYIPKAGEIIIYLDYKTAVVDGSPVNIPGIKIGSGNGYVQDLVFVSGGSGDEEMILAHIADTLVHVTQADRDYWNNKLNVDDNQEVIGESLVFNRN